MIPAILLAGGLGTRLAAVSAGLPKPMMSVAGRPFIEYILDMLIGAGVEKLLMAVSYRSEVLCDHFGSNYKGVSITYSVESEPLGTGGAIQKCFQEHQLERAVVLNGDTLFLMDLEKLVEKHVQENASITMALRRMDNTSRYGVVICDTAGRVTAFRERGGVSSGLVNGGIYVLEHSAFERISPPAKFSFERDFLQKYVAELRPLGMESSSYFIDIGIPEDLARARRELANA